jgi:hypothetical protein
MNMTDALVKEIVQENTVDLRVPASQDAVKELAEIELAYVGGGMFSPTWV